MFSCKIPALRHDGAAEESRNEPPRFYSVCFTGTPRLFAILPLTDSRIVDLPSSFTFSYLKNKYMSIELLLIFSFLQKPGVNLLRPVWFPCNIHLWYWGHLMVTGLQNCKFVTKLGSGLVRAPIIHSV